jgi:microcystin-dependent protein
MATVTTQLNSAAGFSSGETVTAVKLNNLVNSATVTGIVNDNIDAGAAIAASKLATSAQQALLPAGAVMPFAMNSAPAGWLASDGTAVSRSTYSALFAAISTAHGAGDGSTTFNLPDLRGIFVRGSSSQTISGTAYTGTFGAKQNDAIYDHNHSVKYNTYGVNAGSSTAVTILNGAGANTYNVAMQSGTAGTETRPANIALLYCIKF